MTNNMKNPPSSRGSQASYAVGYRKPPSHTKFKKGRSGNGKGRVRGRGNLLTLFKTIAAEKVRMKVDGEAKIMSRAEAVIYVNHVRALQGHKSAFDNFYMLAEEFKQFTDLSDVKQVGGLIGLTRPVLSPDKQLVAANQHAKLRYEEKERLKMAEERKQEEEARLQSNRSK